MLQGFERVQSHPGALLTWLAGEEADIMEETPEDEVRDVLYELLVQFTGRQDLPRPTRAFRSVLVAVGNVIVVVVVCCCCCVVVVVLLLLLLEKLY
jgi:hypothetical protein